MNALRTAHRIGLKGCSTRRGVVYRYGLPAQRGFASTAPSLASLSGYTLNLFDPPPAPSPAGAGCASPSVSAGSPSSSTSAGAASPSTGADANNAGALSRSDGSAPSAYEKFQRDWNLVSTGLKESAVHFHEMVAANQERIAWLEARREESLASVEALKSRLEEQHKESVRALAEHRHHVRQQRQHDREVMKEIQRRQLEARTGTQKLHDSLQELRTSLFDFVLHAKNQDAMYSRTLARLEPAPAKHRVKDPSAAVEKVVVAKVNAEKGLRLSEQIVEEAAVKPAKALGERIATALFWFAGPVCLLLSLASSTNVLSAAEAAVAAQKASGGGASSGGAGGASRSGARSPGPAKAPTPTAPPKQPAPSAASSSAKDAAIVTGGLGAAATAEQAARKAAAADRANSSKPAPKADSSKLAPNAGPAPNGAPQAPPVLGTRRFLSQALPAMVRTGLDTVIPIDRVIADLRDHALLSSDRMTVRAMKHYEFHLLKVFGELRRQNVSLTVRHYLHATRELDESCPLHRIVAWNTAYGKRDLALQTLTNSQRRNLNVSRAVGYGQAVEEQPLMMGLRALDRRAALAGSAPQARLV